uniref:Uncharacterized protein n=1 Tax=Timema douglasi TaxID=61478 RepID=A0A7R8VAD0_TIMDO|nr:unnamed protein product [Timema douglasi]
MIGSEPAFSWRESGIPFRNTPSTPERDSNLDLPVIDSLTQHETSALVNKASEPGMDPDRRLMFPCHSTARHNMEKQRRFFLGRIISRFGDVQWPPLSPDLATPEYSSPMASLVLTDSSQLTSGRQYLGIHSSSMTSLVLTDSSQMTFDSQK